MITQTIHEIHNPFDAYAKQLGECLVLFMVSGSVSSNPQFIVRLYHSGFLRTVDQNDLILYGNPTAGEDLVPDIPEDWIKERNKSRWGKGARRNMDFLNNKKDVSTEKDNSSGTTGITF